MLDEKRPRTRVKDYVRVPLALSSGTPMQAPLCRLAIIMTSLGAKFIKRITNKDN